MFDDSRLRTRRRRRMFGLATLVLIVSAAAWWALRGETRAPAATPADLALVEALEANEARPPALEPLPEAAAEALGPRPVWDTGDHEWLSLDMYSRAESVDLSAYPAAERETLEQGALVLRWQEEPGYRFPRLRGWGVLDAPVEYAWDVIHTAGDSRHLESAGQVRTIKRGPRDRWEERSFSYVVGTAKVIVHNEDLPERWTLRWRQEEGDLVATDGYWRCHPMGARSFLEYTQFTELPVPVPRGPFMAENERAVRLLWDRMEERARELQEQHPLPAGLDDWYAARARLADEDASGFRLSAKPVPSGRGALPRAPTGQTLSEVEGDRAGATATLKPEAWSLKPDSPYLAAPFRRRDEAPEWAARSESERTRLAAREITLHPLALPGSRHRGLQAWALADAPVEFAWEAVHALGEGGALSPAERRELDARVQPDGSRLRTSELRFGLLLPLQRAELRFEDDPAAMTVRWRQIDGPARRFEGSWRCLPLGARSLIVCEQRYDPGTLLVPPSIVRPAMQTATRRRVETVRARAEQQARARR